MSQLFDASPGSGTEELVEINGSKIESISMKSTSNNLIFSLQLRHEASEQTIFTDGGGGNETL